MSKTIKKEDPPIIERYWIVYNTYSGVSTRYDNYEKAMEAAEKLAGTASCPVGHHISVCPAVKVFVPHVRVVMSATEMK